MTAKPLLLLVLSLTTNISLAQIPIEGLVAYYPFNGNANDSSAHGFDGVLADQTLVESPCSQGYSFLNNYIDCGDAADNSFDIVGDATISIWMELLAAPGNYFTLIGKDVGAGQNNKKWFFAVRSTGLTFHINGPGMVGGRWCYSDAFTFSLNTFYHVVLTKSGDDYGFFVNAEHIGSDSLPLGVLDVPTSMRIGKNENSPINAVLDDVLIYNRVLTQAEIDELYVNCTVGLDDAPRPHPPTAFPVPFQNALNIDLSGFSGRVQVDIMNPLGEWINATTTSAGSLYTWDGRTTSATEVPPGMYLVTVIADGQRYTQRVVKQ